MIHFSGPRHVVAPLRRTATPDSRLPERRPPAVLPPKAQALPKFGSRSFNVLSFMQWWKKPEAFVEYDLRKLDSLSGYVPNTSAQALLGRPRASGVVILPRQSDVDELWRKLNLPPLDKPKLDFREEAGILIYDERGQSVPVTPFMMDYNRSLDELRVRIPGDRPRPGQGVAWYFAKIYNGALPEETRRRHWVMDWRQITPFTRVSLYQSPVTS